MFEPGDQAEVTMQRLQNLLLILALSLGATVRSSQEATVIVQPTPAAATSEQRAEVLAAPVSEAQAQSPAVAQQTTQELAPAAPANAGSGSSAHSSTLLTPEEQKKKFADLNLDAKRRDEKRVASENIRDYDFIAVTNTTNQGKYLFI